MATSSTRQRKLARAKIDRQLARRADRHRRQRQVRAAVAGLLVVAVAVLGGMWFGGVFDKKPVPLAAAADCTWTKQDTTANNSLTEEGMPTTTGIPASGPVTMTVAMKTGESTGSVVASLDRNKAKCSIAALTFLSGKGFYGNTKCHELTNAEGSFALKCGDPSGTGNGGANFTWFPENTPSEPMVPSADPSASPAPSASPSPGASPEAGVRYPKGTIAMLPSLYGSQFLIFYKDSTVTSPNYSILGTVTSGWEILDKIVAAGAKANANGANTQPVNDVVIETMTLVDPFGNQQTPAPSVAPSASPAN